MNRYLSFLCVAVFSSVLFFGCEDRHAGGTEVESTITCKLITPEGLPAVGARVRALPEDYLSDGENEAAWSEIDEKGSVVLTVAGKGSYAIEARYVKDSLASGVVRYVSIDDNVQIKIDSLKLETLSRIEGDVPEGQGPSVIRIPGLERFVVPDSAGHFVIDSLPPGIFSVVAESRSNRGTVTTEANSGDTALSVNLGDARGFAVENFESFTGISATGKILGDGWWYTLDAQGKNIMPLWDSTLTMAYSGSAGCASGGCARTTRRLGFLIGKWQTDYSLPGLDTLYFSARGTGSVVVKLARGAFDSTESGLESSIELEKNWKGYAIPVSEMIAYGDSISGRVLGRIDFQISSGDTLFLDDVFLGGVDSISLDTLVSGASTDSSEYPDGNWALHDSLLAGLTGFASGVKGGSGGIVCVVTTTDDYSDDSLTAIAPGSLRECAYKDSAAWILFEKDGTYKLMRPLRIHSYKTIDGRGRDIHLAGMGILTDSSSELIFENLTFDSPSITALDSTSRRALSIHNLSSYVWVDHCTFDSYPLVEMDIKRGSNSVTVSWSKFLNGQTGILFGLAPETFKESAQTFTLHHNYFMNLDNSAVLARSGKLHAYNNFFLDVDENGIACTDSAECFVENNIFNIATAVSICRLYDSDGNPVDTTGGFIEMSGNWFSLGGEDLDGDANGFSVTYPYELDSANANLAWKIKEGSGPR